MASPSRYVEQGPRRDPLIRLDGFPDSWLSYETVLADLPSTIRAIALSSALRQLRQARRSADHPRDLGGRCSSDS